MSLIACRYAVVQFLPYAETGEFANVGIVLLCPEARYFGFRLQNTRRSGRITRFFERLERSVFTRSLDILHQELQRVAGHLEQTVFAQGNTEAARAAFTALTHPREAILRFSSPRALMAASPQEALDTLFGRYVEHDFATPEHREEVLEKRIGEFLKALPLDKPFHAHTLGNEETRARFPFVLMDGERIRKAIKPLFLAQKETHKIYEHADHWLPKLRRLRTRGLLPEATLISTEAPAKEDSPRYRAFMEICDELAALELATIPAQDESGLRRFALM